jgi:hypothetical protein
MGATSERVAELIRMVVGLPGPGSVRPARSAPGAWSSRRWPARTNPGGAAGVARPPTAPGSLPDRDRQLDEHGGPLSTADHCARRQPPASRRRAPSRSGISSSRSEPARFGSSGQLADPLQLACTPRLVRLSSPERLRIPGTLAARLAEPRDQPACHLSGRKAFLCLRFQPPKPDGDIRDDHAT